MTKRFEHTKANLMQSYISTFREYMIYDNALEDAYFVKSDEHCVECLVDLLNQLNDENEQLRQELNDCEKFRHSIFKRMNELTDKLKEKEEDEKQYAEEILKLREINQFNELGGDY